ncbi:MAG: hypothetical protein GXY67_09195 [Clostridiales bacterium]|nr:hypothetical protein [Clostridiales bacterium]
MKKICSFALVLCMILSCTVAFAASPAITLPSTTEAKGDQPFEDGVYYGEKYNDYGARPSMLNFGSANLSPGESLYDAKTTTIKKARATEISEKIDRLTFYCYAKWQYAQHVDDHTINAMLVMTSPSGLYYATYGVWELIDLRAKTICSWFFDVTDCLKRCRDDNGGTLEKGEYAFSMFFNDMSFRVTKVRFN